ncbi:Hexaprenyldihydroxybenzoate methyltransferase, mitochondrial [Tulasnella sp. 424]|nr:Hexaprenyldihydroxybenzoate methyltransferase, mitochondrial [Tulasnella sp. 424]KAG8974461.1 Hexaprenyldihydroxybenzoate methyltransferase, mitochondrial [Tulasnella sp. 425]
MRISRRLLSAAASASTANPSEIAFFSRLSQQWWDESGEFAFLHRMNPVRVGYIRDKILATIEDEAPTPSQGRDTVRALGARPLAGLDILDIGCGGGLLCESLARLGGRTLGIDASASNIAIATLHASQDPRLSGSPTSSNVSSQSLEYKHTTSEELLASKGKPAQFDVVCSMEVLEHVDHPDKFLRSCADLVKPGGHLFLSTISRTPLSQFLTITMAENILGLVSRGTHDYAKYVKPSELVEFFRNELRWIRTPSTGSQGALPFDQAELRGMAYLPWAGKWILAPRGAPMELDCNYLFWARKPKLPQ